MILLIYFFVTGAGCCYCDCFFYCFAVSLSKLVFFVFAFLYLYYFFIQVISEQVSENEFRRLPFQLLDSSIEKSYGCRPSQTVQIQMENLSDYVLTRYFPQWILLMSGTLFFLFFTRSLSPFQASFFSRSCLKFYCYSIYHARCLLYAFHQVI